MVKPWDEISNFVCYYGSFVPELGDFDVAIVDSESITASQLTQLKNKGVYMIAYLSIGEDEQLNKGDGKGPGGYASYYINDKGKPAQNDEWGSYYVNAGNKLWQDTIIKHASNLINKGYDGLFLDTIDTAEKYPTTRSGMASLIQNLHQTFPNAKLVANRGFFMLNDFASQISGLMFEEFTSHYNDDKNRYELWAADDLEWTTEQADKINQIRKRYPFVVFALDYCNPSNTSSIQKCYKRAWLYNFVPYVSTIHLDKVYHWNIKS